MVNSTIKRSVATLGVVAGLLAAAVPTTALGSTGVAQDTQAGRTSSLENTMVSGNNVKAVVVLIGANDYGFVDRATPAGSSS